MMVHSSMGSGGRSGERRADLSTRRDVPQADRSVVRARDYESAIVGVSEARNGCGVAL